MSKKRNKNLRDEMPRDNNLPNIATTGKKDKGDKPAKTSDKKHERREHIDPPPVATLLCNTIADQITRFLDHDPADRKANLDSLFTLGGLWPAGITGCEGAENYMAYQVERTAKMDRDDDTKMRRMSTSIVVIDTRTAQPAFFLTAYVAPSESAAVQVYVMGEKGPDYRQTAKWNGSNRKQQ